MLSKLVLVALMSGFCKPLLIGRHPVKMMRSRPQLFMSADMSTSFDMKYLENEVDEEDHFDVTEQVKMLSHSRSRNTKYGKSLEDCPALVLNANFLPLSYFPLSLWNWQDSLRAVLSDKAVALHYYDYAIRSVSITVQVPSVIVLKKFQKMPEKTPPMTRRNVYLRDGFKCQYCFGRFPPSSLSLDHVHPRSKGGKLSWTNTVCCCLSCNHKKGSNLPNELPKLGMRLKNPPREPSYYELQHKAKQFRKFSIHSSWDSYL